MRRKWIMPVAKNVEIDKMKTWLGDGEIDIDLMIRMGELTEDSLVEICESLTDSPWFKPNLKEALAR